MFKKKKRKLAEAEKRHSLTQSQELHGVRHYPHLILFLEMFKISIVLLYILAVKSFE